VGFSEGPPGFRFQSLQVWVRGTV